jgi:LacI family transcriptional regulator
VHAAAREVGYVASSAARALATGRTGRIGFVPSDPKDIVGNPYFHRVLNGMIDSAAELGYGLVLHTRPFDDVAALAAEIRSGATDAAVILGRYEDDELTERLHELGFPIVSASYQSQVVGVPVVDVDKPAQGRLLRDALLANGHSRAALFSPEEPSSWNRQLREALVEGNRLQLIDKAFFSEATISELRDERVTALVFAQELAALIAISELTRLGMPPPESFSIVAVLHLAQHLPTGLAGCSEPVELVGKTALSTAVDLVSGHPVDPVRILPVTWVPGATLGTP